MKTIVDLSGNTTEIDENNYPLSKYSKEIVDHIESNSFLSKEFFDNEMLTIERMQQIEQRAFGSGIIGKLIDIIGERNLQVIKSGQVINMMEFAADNAGIKLLIETGALATARSAALYYKTKYVTHEDIYTKLNEDITRFLIEKGYV